MENPAKLRRRIAVLAGSPGKTRILVKRRLHELVWDIPDSHLHWPLGRKKGAPLNVASRLLQDASLGLIGDLQQVRKQLSTYGGRKKLPTGGFAYIIPSSSTFNITLAAENASKVRKHLHLECERVEMHSLVDIMSSESHLKYGGGTIEAVRSTCSKSGALPNFSES
jgi:hypothetical protein